MNVQKLYECPACRRDYLDIDDAQTCCEPTIIYRCSCKKYHHDKDDAEKCCNQNENEKLKEQLKLG